MNESDFRSSRRKKNTIVIKPIIIGTYATMFSQQEIARRNARSDSATHRWICVVRDPLNEDTSYYIRKVTITLHPTFTSPQRVFGKPPYEVHEVGWGEFDISVKIYFVDTSERPVELKHRLKLYPTDVEDLVRCRPSDGTSNCIVSESYDEIFFIDPTERFHDILANGPISPNIHFSVEDCFLKNHGKEEYLAAMCKASAFVNKNIEKAKESFIKLTLDIEKMKRTFYGYNESKAMLLLKREAHK